MAVGGDICLDSGRIKEPHGRHVLHLPPETQDTAGKTSEEMDVVNSRKRKLGKFKDKRTPLIIRSERKARQNGRGPLPVPASYKVHGLDLPIHLRQLLEGTLPSVFLITLP